MKSLDITDIYSLGNVPLVKQLTLKDSAFFTEKTWKNITENTIKDFIEKCTVKDFTPNSLGVIDNDVLSDYIDAMITDSIILESILN